MDARFTDEIIVFCGPMYSGKSCAMLLFLDKLRYANIPYKVFKPDMDRFSDSIQSRYRDVSEHAISIDVKDPKSLLDHLNFAEIKLPFTVAIDEAQFFSDEIFEVVEELHKRGIKVVIAGLDVDAWGLPFGPVPKLLSLATKVIKFVAACTKCGAEATRTSTTARKVNGSNILVGDEDAIFFPTCSKCFWKYYHPE